MVVVEGKVKLVAMERMGKSSTLIKLIKETRKKLLIKIKNVLFRDFHMTGVKGHYHRKLEQY